MRKASVGWCFASMCLLACGQSALPREPQNQSPEDAGVDASTPPTGPDAGTRPPRDAGTREPTQPPVRDGGMPPRDATPPMQVDATAPERDAGAAMPVPDDDAGAPDASQPSDAGSAEPVACSTDAPPPHESACAIEGEICAHWRTVPETGYDAYFACNCIAVSSTRTLWNCYENLGGSVQCPHEQPEDGSSCDGYRDRTCPYPPRVTCTCPLDPSRLNWECSEGTTLAEAPATWPMTTPVRELDDATRQAFCAWYVDATTEDGFPAPPEPQPTPDGFFPSNGCTGCGGGLGFNGMMPFPLPASACAANLGLSTCEQPLSELVDCVRSLWSECWPSPRGCARYLESPGCAGTLVVQTAGGPAVDCRIKVR